MSEALGKIKPSTIIVAFRNAVISDIYSLAFEGIFNSTVISCSDAKTACDGLKKNPEACLLIESAIGGSLNVLFQNQAYFAKRAKVFVLGGGPDLLPVEAENLPVEFLPENPEMKEVVAKIESALRLEESAMEYCRVSIKTLLVRRDKLRCDVFLKLGNDKFVKLLHADGTFDETDYERFRAKNIEFMYVPRTDFLEMMDDLLAKVSELNQNPEKITVEVAQNINVAIFKTVLSAFETDGFTPQLQRLTVASVNLAINTIQKNPKLGDLLSRLNKNRDTYLSWHSTALGFLSCRLATMLGWQSEATFYKLSFASLLHDIVLSSDELAKIQTIEQLNASGLSDRDRAKVQRHPLEGSNLLQNLEEVPSEIAFIIEQHHERQDGSGFPRGIDHKEISSISALFIISHDIVTTMYDAPPENFQIRGFLTARDIDKTYTKGAFGQVFRSIIASSADL